MKDMDPLLQNFVNRMFVLVLFFAVNVIVIEFYRNISLYLRSAAPLHDNLVRFLCGGRFFSYFGVHFCFINSGVAVVLLMGF